MCVDGFNFSPKSLLYSGESTSFLQPPVHIWGGQARGKSLEKTQARKPTTVPSPPSVPSLSLSAVLCSCSREVAVDTTQKLRLIRKNSATTFRTEEETKTKVVVSCVQTNGNNERCLFTETKTKLKLTNTPNNMTVVALTDRHRRGRRDQTLLNSTGAYEHENIKKERPTSIRCTYIRFSRMDSSERFILCCGKFNCCR